MTSTLPTDHWDFYTNQLNRQIRSRENVPSGQDENRFTFAGVPSASTTSAWTFSPQSASTFISQSSMQLPIHSYARRANGSPKLTSTSLSRVTELDSEALDDMPNDLSALFDKIDVLHIFTTLDEMPFALLDALIGQLQNNGSLEELHICLQLPLRPALQAISNNFGLQRGLKHLISKWASSGTTLKFYFLLPQCIDRPEEDTFGKYWHIDILPALEDLGNGSARLEDALALVKHNGLDAQSSTCHCASESEERDELDLMDTSE
ncbi:hypothetical protein DE146DRAFT_775493 [Phaeosphaeria sp. MPI-PUGE-AT-0046c]|nr:hypothetical protein DE146DRAFT_775493 [Phaeosphaeria sp. MPI-PUGE-AT-0046c]